ncbi:hypothetical protein [Brumicola blandensis]|uniref:Uncharacterized protein n=1 Tax=Brumicola blandensis TaxID=3075611 RepID=A0AAW8QYE8_9ALTE|nr:hypothetical protein [Alteromonas sp. W409]MDT0581524.1 hypothetical protein [Alteromonas sp. W409]
MKKLLTICVLGVCLMSPFSDVKAQDSILEDSYITTQEFFEAEVMRVKRADRVVVVRGANKGDIREFFVPEGAEITIKGKKARLRDIRKGDVMLITMSPKTERITIAKIRVPETEMTLTERREAPVEEVLPAVLPQTASSWYSILFLGGFAAFLATVLRIRKVVS